MRAKQEFYLKFRLKSLQKDWLTGDCWLRFEDNDSQTELNLKPIRDG